MSDGIALSTPSRPLALVTGASSGIGEQFARRYAREGYDLLLVARSADVLRTLADDLATRHGVAAGVHRADLSHPADVATLVAQITDGLPRIDHVVNCAGATSEGDLVDADEQALRDVVELNVTALTLLTRAAIVRMRAAGHGTIVNVASAAAYQPMPHLAAYSASKSYVLMLTEALSEENRAHGLRIFAVSPGDTDTPMSTAPMDKRRRPEQVVDTAWKALSGRAPSVVDGRTNSLLTTLSTRVFPKRFGLRTAERMMRDKA
jgi:short-subunit dehydrogenase